MSLDGGSPEWQLAAMLQAPRRARRDLLVDTFVESYVEWREECNDLRRAYQRWAACAGPDRDLAFRAYRAALDREEKAASVHEVVSRRLGLAAQCR